MVSLDSYEALRAAPGGAPSFYQSWRSLLFLHFRCDPTEIQRLLPEGLEVDTFDNSAWVGIVPFLMERIRPRGLPPLPGISWFPETNVRTYVHRKGVPGVWFFSLDAASPLACSVGRRLFQLPYHDARMGVADDGERITYEGMRCDQSASSVITCSVGMNLPLSEPGSLENFLVERYLLYSKRGDTLMQGRVHHKPYALRAAHLEGIEENLVKAAGVIPRPIEHAIYSPGVDVRVYRLTNSD